MLILALAALGVGAAHAAPAPLRLVARKLPGLEIALPEKAQLTQEGDYGDGKVTAALTTPNLHITVTWQSAGPIDDAGIEMEIRLLTRNHGMSVEKARRDVTVAVPGGLPTRSWTVPLEKVSLWLTHVQCTNRRLTIITGAPAGAEALHRRLVGSLRCQPDAAAEQRLGEVPLVVPLPATGWSRLHGDSDLMLSDGKTILIAMTTSGPPDEKLVQTMVANMYKGDHHLGAPDGDERPFEGHDEGALLSGWLTTRHCAEPDRHILLLTLIGGDRADAKAGRALLHATRCRKPGETAQSWPAYGKD